MLEFMSEPVKIDCELMNNNLVMVHRKRDARIPCKWYGLEELKITSSEMINNSF